MVVKVESGLASGCSDVLSCGGTYLLQLRDLDSVCDPSFPALPSSVSWQRSFCINRALLVFRLRTGSPRWFLRMCLPRRGPG